MHLSLWSASPLPSYSPHEIRGPNVKVKRTKWGALWRTREVLSFPEDLKCPWQLRKLHWKVMPLQHALFCSSYRVLSASTPFWTILVACLSHCGYNKMLAVKSPCYSEELVVSYDDSSCQLCITEVAISGNVRGISLTPCAISPSSRSWEAVTCEEACVVCDATENCQSNG